MFMFLLATHINTILWRVSSSTKTEWFFIMCFSVTEKESLVTSLQQEVQQLKELNQSQGKTYVSSWDNFGCACHYLACTQWFIKTCVGTHLISTCQLGIWSSCTKQIVVVLFHFYFRTFKEPYIGFSVRVKCDRYYWY